MAELTLVTGGARSGKSTYALELAKHYAGKRVFVATAEAFDQEMKERIALHQKERAHEGFETLESPYELPETLTKIDTIYKVVLVDCLTVWLGNLYHHHPEDESKIQLRLDALVKAVQTSRLPVIMVTNEVGCSIVPENALARKFRDMAGRMNRLVASQCHQVFLCVCGIPLKIK